MELFYTPFIVVAVLIVLPFAACQKFSEVNKDLREAERLSIQNKTELLHEYDLIKENKKISDEKLGY